MTSVRQRIIWAIIIWVLSTVAPGQAIAWTGSSLTIVPATNVFGSTRCTAFLFYNPSGVLRWYIEDSSSTTPHIGGKQITGGAESGGLPAPTETSLESCSYIKANSVELITSKFEDSSSIGSMTELSFSFVAVIENNQTVDFSPFNGNSQMGDGNTKYQFEMKFSGPANAAPTLTSSISAVETTPPAVQSIAVSGAPAADATSVDFVVTFDESANISAPMTLS